VLFSSGVLVVCWIVTVQKPLANAAQLMYDTSGAGVQLRKYMGVSLAWWHSYKWCSKRIIQVFASDFFGPMFHHLFPHTDFHPDKMSHTAITTYLSYVRLAYPAFKNRLVGAMSRSGLTERQACLLQNLSDLCEYFIPVVRAVVFIIYSYS
jgi:hypothetical protein